MYENMAEFCLLGCNRHAGTDDKKAQQAQQAQQARQAWEVVKSAKRQPAPRYSRHTGSASNRQAAYSFFQRQAGSNHQGQAGTTD